MSQSVSTALDGLVIWVGFEILSRNRYEAEALRKLWRDESGRGNNLVRPAKGTAA